MGYTHYWKSNINGVSKVIDWESAIEDCKKIIESCGIPLDIEACDDECICFNGVGSNAAETFLIGFNEPSSFCKTYRRPYDAVVVAILARMAEVEGFTVSSDGSPNDWEEGVALATKILGRKVVCPTFNEG